MTGLEIFAISVLALFTAILSGVAGMGGGVALLAAMTFVVPYNALVPLHGTTQLISNSSRAIFLFKHIHKKIFLFFLIGMPMGVVIATELIRSLPSRVFPLILLASLIAYALFKPKKLPPLKIPVWAFALVGVIAGMLGILVGATGPFLAVFFLRDDLIKEEIVSTKATMQMAVHTLKIPAYFYLGFDYLSHWHIILILALSSLVGTRIGVSLLKKVKDTLFRKIYRIALFAALLRIAYMVSQSV